MSRDDCIALLASQSKSVLPPEQDVTVLLEVGEEQILVSTSTGVVEASTQESCNNEMPTFFFNEWQTVWNLLSGNADLGTVFLQGNVRSNGYLTYLFPIMAMFQQSRSTTAPE